MNSVGLNVFIAIVGISSGPTFVAGLQAARLRPVLLGHRRDDGAADRSACSSANTSSASTPPSSSALCPAPAPRPPRSAWSTMRAKSQIPALGYTVTYAVGNTLLTIWGMVLVMLLT